MATEQNKLPEIISHCKEYGFIFPSSEIYDGLSAVYDYGQWGVELKKNIKDLWWKSIVYMNENIVGIDSAIFMHPTIWKASGHVDNFSDPMIDNLDSKKRYRVDHLIEGHCESLAESNKPLAEKLLLSMDALLASDDFEGLKKLIIDNQMKCAVSGTCNWTDVRQFNLMFSTQLGSVAEESDTIYLRPETAQGIFVNFLNVQKTGRMKIPFGIAQIGKAFRNEIVARGFIFRMREFEQMEMQFFVRPGTQKEWYEHWKQTRMQWHMDIFGEDKKEAYRFHDHVKLAHYADAACDIEFDFPMGFKEVEGIHSRTDFDLTQHQLYSKKKMQYFDNDIDETTGKPYGNYIPYVVETSIGLDRTILMALTHAYCEEDLSTAEKQDSRVLLKFPIKIAPIKLAVFPLMKKDGLAEIAKELMKECRDSFLCFYEEKDAIGKRYRRMDALGTPFCVTIDHQTKEDGTVTIRYRDSMEQERVKMSDVKDIVLKALHA
jgi:glycyl-tRNA synthetase